MTIGDLSKANIPEHIPAIQFYISAKVNAGEDEVQKVADILEANGYQWSYDWRKSKIDKPYTDSQFFEHNQDEAMAMVNGILNSDLFVLIGNDNLVGSYIKLGIAIGYQVPTAIIAPTKQSLFFTMPNVYLFDSIDDFAQSSGYTVE